jgi:hypothetical protein
MKYLMFAKVRLGSNTEVAANPSYVRFTLRSGGTSDARISTLWAIPDIKKGRLSPVSDPVRDPSDALVIRVI